VVCVGSQREDRGFARRSNAILWLDDGKSCQASTEFLYMGDDTVRGWYKTFRAGGWHTISEPM
jgi:transposase